MMPMQGFPTQPLEFPSAILLTRLSDIKFNNNILYRMVRPTEQGTEVVSVNRLVNVVPFRRIYRFDRKAELNDFCNELLRRPIVMQPVVHFGRGLGGGAFACGLCYKDDKWVMMINQTHPKILGRLQIGLDAARNAMARGQSCEIRFAFSKMVEKIYKESLTRSEQENAAKTLDLVKSYFRFAEWEFGDLIIRYHGYAAMMGRGGGLSDLSTLHLTFSFEDLMYQEICWKTLGDEVFPKPHLAPVTEDEIREYLPAWTVNGVSPLENIGDTVPQANYSYAQAGRLYESFRKKKRRQPAATDGIELKVTALEDKGRRHARDEEYLRHDQDYHHRYNDGAACLEVGNEEGGFHRPPQDEHVGYPEDDGFYESKGAKPKRVSQQDSYGHMYPEVRVNTPRSQTNDKYSAHKSFTPGQNAYMNANAPPLQSDYAHPSMQQRADGHQKNPYSSLQPSQDNHGYAPLSDQFTRLRMQGSDRSSHSEAGSGVSDSGICSDSDGHIREGSFEKFSHPKVQQHSPMHPYARDNPGFHSDEADVSDAMRRHKELVAKMMGGSQSHASSMDTRKRCGYYDHVQQNHTSQSSDRDRENLERNGVLSPKSFASSPTSPNGSHNSYAAAGKAGYGHATQYGQNLHSPKQLVEESFI